MIANKYPDWSFPNASDSQPTGEAEESPQYPGGLKLPRTLGLCSPHLPSHLMNPKKRKMINFLTWSPMTSVAKEVALAWESCLVVTPGSQTEEQQ